MADADEDIIPRIQPSSLNDPSADLEDEAQDFRFLAALTAAKSSGGALPRRGEKDFEPNPTQAQSNTLAASRGAMHTALSMERILIPWNQLVGQYLPDSADWRWDVRPRMDRRGRGGRCVVIEKFKTTFARTFGVGDYRNWNWLLPEEALFLLERGTLDIRWPDDGVRQFMKGGLRNDNDEEGDGIETSDDAIPQDNADDIKKSEDIDQDGDPAVEDDGSVKKKRPNQHYPLQVGEMPMSLQGAYASFIGKSGLTLERYNVYAGLRRLGYVVKRAPTWDEEEDDSDEAQLHANNHTSGPNGHVTEPLSANATSPPTQTVSFPQWNSATSLINRLVSYLFTSQPRHYNSIRGPLIYPGLYRNYNDIFRTLSLNLHETSTSTKRKPKPPFTIAWHVWKPSNTQYRKTAEPEPDFRLAVLDARTTCMPTAAEIGELLDSMPMDELPKDKRMEQRMKHGVRNVVLAVVDCGLVSYLRMADMCSGVNGRVFETKTARAAKRGGGFKRGGRGGRGGRR